MQAETAVMPIEIRKRDGKTRQPFDEEKIARAIRGAWLEVGGYDEGRARVVAMAAAAEARAAAIDGVVEIETVQDLVEYALMRNKLFKVAKAYVLYRQKRAEARGMRQHPDPKAVSDYIHAAKYAKYLPELRRREVYEETVARTEAMHLRRFPQLAVEIRGAFNLVREKRVLPSMRSMQFGGAAVEAVENRLYNCSATHVDRLEAFSQAFFLLLCGCGVGYSVQFEHVDKLPEFGFVDKKGVRHHVIADSIEGWADAALALLRSFVSGEWVEFAYHLVRNEGTPLKTSGGKAPGHLALKRSLEAVRTILLQAQGRRLRPIECHEIMCLFADAVLSGGIRRSSLICLFSLEDSEMMYCKTGDWYSKRPWLSNANNSCVLKRDEVKEQQFLRIFQMTKQFGEPGFIFVNDKNAVTNPCQPSWATVLTPEGIRTIGDVDVGSTIWSGQRWTKITKKWSTGIKPVFAFRTRAGTFYGTENHRVVSEGQKIEAGKAKSIDRAAHPNLTKLVLEPQNPNLIISILYLGEEEVFDLTVEAEEHTYWTDGLLVSNCAEISLNCRLEITHEVLRLLKERARRGKPMPDVKLGEVYTGFAFCNLCELNASKFETFADFLRAARAAALIGTLQASYTDMPYLGWVSEVIAEREALLGIGMTGMMDSPEIALDPQNQREVAEKVVEWNEEFAAEVGIRPAARITTVKPGGTTSLALGVVGSGIHPQHARRYIRRVTANELESVFQHFKTVNPHMCVRKPNGDWVIEFPAEALPGARVKRDFSAIEFLEIVKSTQQNWVATGTARPESSPGYVHNVSNTVPVADGEWEQVAAYLWNNKKHFSGVSFIPIDNKVYPFMPFEEVVTEADEARWNQLLANYRPVDYLAMIEEDDATSFTQEPACAGGSCEIPQT